jgi:hypothetical protein
MMTRHAFSRLLLVACKCVTILGIVTVLTIVGWRDTPMKPAWAANHGSEEDQSLSDEARGETLDDLLAEVARRVPDFGGIFIGPDGTPQIYVLDPRMAGAALEAIEAVFGPGRLSQGGIQVLPGQRLSQGGIQVLPGQYRFVQLADAQPANDDIAHALSITGVPFAAGLIDTRAATAVVDDPHDCVTNGSIWYTFTPTADISLEIHTIGSDYDTALGVYVGSPGALHLTACNDDFYGFQSAVLLDATANTTYYIMIGSCCDTGGTGGGTLFFNVEEAPPSVDITPTVNAQGSFDKAGAATIEGTIACNTETSFTQVTGTLQQRVGRTFISGSFSIDPAPCFPPSSRWSVTVVGDGLFRGGSVTADVSVSACDGFSCDFERVQQTIQLKGEK